MNEVWMPVLGYETFYEVSNFGQVKSLGRTAEQSGRTLPERILKIQKTTNGYRFVTMCKGGVAKMRMVHRIVIEAFYGYKDLDVNHKDFDKTNNELENLEYCNRRENMIHCFAARSTTSNHNGISLFKATKMWEVKICHKRVNHFLGRYKTEAEAISVQQLYLPKIIESTSIEEAKEIVANLITQRKQERINKEKVQYRDISVSNYINHDGVKIYNG